MPILVHLTASAVTWRTNALPQMVVGDSASWNKPKKALDSLQWTSFIHMWSFTMHVDVNSEHALRLVFSLQVHFYTVYQCIICNCYRNFYNSYNYALLQCPWLSSHTAPDPQTSSDGHWHSLLATIRNQYFTNHYGPQKYCTFYVHGCHHTQHQILKPLQMDTYIAF